MKNNYLYNWVVIVFMMLQMLAFTSCSDDDDNSGWPTETDKTEIFIERFSTLVTNLTALRDGATYGELKDNYPVSSKAMLDDEIDYLEETIAKLKEGNKKLADSEADRIIREANQIEKNFRATRRTEDFLPVAAELLVNGKNGGCNGKRLCGTAAAAPGGRGRPQKAAGIRAAGYGLSGDRAGCGSAL